MTMQDAPETVHVTSLMSLLFSVMVSVVEIGPPMSFAFVVPVDNKMAIKNAASTFGLISRLLRLGNGVIFLRRSVNRATQHASYWHR